MTETTKELAFVRSKNLRNLTPSATLAVTQEAQRRRAAGEDVIDLSAGEPDFRTPRAVADAGVKAIHDGKTGYPPNPGILELRTAAARHLSLLSGGRPVNADHIIVSVRLGGSPSQGDIRSKDPDCGEYVRPEDHGCVLPPAQGSQQPCDDDTLDNREALNDYTRTERADKSSSANSLMTWGH